MFDDPLETHDVVEDLHIFGKCLISGDLDNSPISMAISGSQNGATILYKAIFYGNIP